MSSLPETITVPCQMRAPKDFDVYSWQDGDVEINVDDTYLYISREDVPALIEFLKQHLEATK